MEYRLLQPAAFESNPSPRGWDGWAGMAFRLVEKLREGDLWQASKRYLWRKWVARSRIQPVKNFSLPTASSVRAVDPSEAVRSAEILPLLRHYFEIVEFKPLGGSILQFLLADIAGNFHDETGRQLLEMLFAIEDTLLACGELQSDFVYVVASPSET